MPDAIRDPTLLEYIRALTPLLGAILIALAGFSAYLLNSRARTRRHIEERRNFASALAGELSAIFTLIDQKKYIRDFRAVRRGLRAGEDVRVFPRHVGERFFHVFEQNADRIATLPTPLPGQVTRIYALLRGIQDDLRTTLTADWNGAPPDYRIRTIDHIITQLKMALAEGDLVRRELDALTGPTAKSRRR